jgi:uncharacterized damage-inducible protein DinB
VSIRPCYADWEAYQCHLVDAVRDLTPAQLALRASPDQWPIWATVAHLAGGRAYWLCAVAGESGVERTPFGSVEALLDLGWEDDLDHPRSASELVDALEATWTIVAGCLDRWTPEMLGDTIVRTFGGVSRPHTRRSILLRLLSHDASHTGEISLTLGMHGHEPIDLWPASDHPAIEA